MKSPPSTGDIRRFRRFLDEHGYGTDGLLAALASARPPTETDHRAMFEATREITPFNLLARLFLLGAPADRRSVEEVLPADLVAMCFAHGLLTETAGTVDSRIVIVPVDDLLFASDAFSVLGTAEAADFVLPASTHSANFLRLLTLREPVGAMLDLGCGCGIHALFAARHSAKVVATDISRAALRYTAFNAALNGLDNVETLEGSLFEPVAGRRFDLIVSNPPFVVSPSETFVYRDNPLELDAFCHVLLREAPACLADDGHLQMLCEWVEVEDESWESRVADSIRGCDAWVLRTPPVPPAAYVATRRNDITGGGDMSPGDDWLSYLESRRVRAIHPCMMTLRHRRGENWLHFQNLSQDVTRPAGDAITAGFEAIDFLTACSDEDLLEATLTLPPGLHAERREATGDGVSIYLRLDDGLGSDAEIDGAVGAFLNLFDGRRTLRECIDAFAGVVDADRAQLTRDLVTITRTFVSRRFLVAAELQ